MVRLYDSTKCLPKLLCAFKKNGVTANQIHVYIDTRPHCTMPLLMEINNIFFAIFTCTCKSDLEMVSQISNYVMKN